MSGPNDSHDDWISEMRSMEEAAFRRGAEAMRAAAAKACEARAAGHRNGFSKSSPAYEREAKWASAAIRALPLPSAAGRAQREGD